ncbi:hypothetical protein FOCC_FOCC005340 [Frankliniella occidentalis]|nr:hypothetical protein FOCC_FOCC005340 [Frankliniella occidentalis]
MQGDSGGPLQIATQSPGGGVCLHQLVGVVSFGPACGIGLPGVYTRVAHYVPWIESVVWSGAHAPSSPAGATCAPLRRLDEDGTWTDLQLPVTGNGTLARRRGRGALGRHYRSKDRQEVAIAEAVPHPDYVSDRRYNDIALLRLTKPVKMSALVRPVCLHTATHGSEVGRRISATGWGASGYWQAVDGDLLMAELTVRDADACREAVAAEGLPGGLHDTQLCTGGVCSNTTHPGEPGAPLQFLDRVLQTTQDVFLQVHRLVGVASLTPPCGRCLPDIHSRVSAFVPWIESVVWPEDESP